MKRKVLKISILAGGLLLLVAAMMPWKVWLGSRLAAMLEAKGFRDVHLTVSAVSPTSMALENITVGNAAPLTLKNLTIAYSLSDLWQGNLQELTLRGLLLEARQTRGDWTIAGFDRETGSKTASGKVAIPVTQAQLAAIPLDRLTLEDSSLQVAADSWQLFAPLQLTWQKLPEPKLSYHATALKLTMPPVQAEIGSASLEAALVEKDGQWQGKWELKNISAKGISDSAPVLAGTGSLAVQLAHTKVKGQVINADGSYKAEFSLDYWYDQPEKSALILDYVTLPWSEGMLSARKVQVPLQGSRIVRANLDVQHVSLNLLLQSLIGERATATGLISGTVPVTLGPENAITVQNGSLKAEGAGIITMPSDVIPGDNQQIALLRGVLNNFHYSRLSMEIDSDKNKMLSVLLTLEGNNPDLYDGRPVKLNVHLTGDMLDLIRQSIVPLSNPRAFLKQGAYEQK